MSDSSVTKETRRSYFGDTKRGRNANRQTVQAKNEQIASAQHCKMYGDGHSECGNCPTPSLMTNIVSQIVKIASSHAFCPRRCT